MSRPKSLSSVGIKLDLTLSQLWTILEGHHREDPTADLYHQLINITQTVWSKGRSCGHQIDQG